MRDQADAVVPPLLELVRLHDAVGAFEAEDRADRQPGARGRVVLRGLPLGHVLAQVVAGADDPQLAHPLERVVVARSGPCRSRRPGAAAF